MVKRYNRKVNIRGAGFFGDLWNGVKSGANWIKDNHILSTVGSLIPDARAQAGAKVLGSFGLGRKKRKDKKVVNKAGKGALILPGSIRAMNGHTRTLVLKK
jgi:hypothetical protein